MVKAQEKKQPMAPAKGKTLRRSNEEGLCMEQGGLIGSGSIVEINHLYFFDAIVKYMLEW